MTAALPQQVDPSPRCATCGGAAEFGYRDKPTGELSWYWAAHRLGQFYADARLSPNKQGETDAENFERSDLETAERRAGVSHTVDGAKRNRPDPGVDGAGLAGPADRVALPQADSAGIGQPYFDADGRYIHRCSRCDKPAMLGFGVSLRTGKLGTWYCGDCAPAQTNEQGEAD
jgi:hypothetical protein